MYTKSCLNLTYFLISKEILDNCYCYNKTYYYPTLLRRVQMTRETSTNITRYLFQAGTVTNPTIWVVLCVVLIFLSLTLWHGHSNACVSFFIHWVFFFRLRAWKKVNKIFTGLGSVRIVKNCDLGLENAALGLRLRAAFSRPRSQLFVLVSFPRPRERSKTLASQNFGETKTLDNKSLIRHFSV